MCTGSNERQFCLRDVSILLLFHVLGLEMLEEVVNEEIKVPVQQYIEFSHT